MDKSEGKDWFAKTLNSVTEETAKIYKISRMKFELNTINKSKHEKLNLMGRKLIDYIASEKIDAKLFEPEYSTILKLEEKREQLEAEIDNIKSNIKIGKSSEPKDDEDNKDDDVIKIISSESIDISDKENDDKKTVK